MPSLWKGRVSTGGAVTVVSLFVQGFGLVSHGSTPHFVRCFPPIFPNFTHDVSACFFTRLEGPGRPHCFTECELVHICWAGRLGSVCVGGTWLGNHADWRVYRVYSWQLADTFKLSRRLGRAFAYRRCCSFKIFSTTMFFHHADWEKWEAKEVLDTNQMNEGLIQTSFHVQIKEETLPL